MVSNMELFIVSLIKTLNPNSTHLSMKEGSLFCFVLYCFVLLYFVSFYSCEIHQTGMLQIVFMVSLESSGQRGVHGACLVP
jgi:hypothetical protein